MRQHLSKWAKNLTQIWIDPLNRIIQLFCLLLLCFTLSACSGAVYNSRHFDDSQLASIDGVLQYPSNYHVSHVNGLNALDVSYGAYGYRKIEPGTHKITWVKLTFGDYEASGKLMVDFSPGESYRLGAYKSTGIVSVWESKTGKIVSRLPD